MRVINEHFEGEVPILYACWMCSSLIEYLKSEIEVKKFPALNKKVDVYHIFECPKCKEVIRNLEGRYAE